MSLRRFGPLLGLFLFSLVLLAARLHEVQVTEHGVWAREAFSLLRDSETLPARRGSIVDRHGRPVAHDQEVYEVEFVWRDFRRENPLGIVCQARSLLEGRAVSLEEAQRDLGTWAQALVGLTPEELEAFARGEGLELAGVRVAPCAGQDRRERRRSARAEWRSSRAGDVRFYVESLLGQTKSEARRLRGLDRDEWDARSFAARIAAVREGLRDEDPRVAEQQLLDRVADDAERSALHLRSLAVELASEDDGFGNDPTHELLEVLDGVRSECEGAVADALFREATGLSPRRLSTANLRRLDLDWLRRALVWSEGDLASWTGERGSSWEPSQQDPRPELAEGTTLEAALRRGEVELPPLAIAPARLAYSRLQYLLEQVPHGRFPRRAPDLADEESVRALVESCADLWRTVLAAAFDDPDQRGRSNAPSDADPGDGRRDPERLTPWRQVRGWVVLERLSESLEGADAWTHEQRHGVLPLESQEAAGRPLAPRPVLVGAAHLSDPERQEHRRRVNEWLGACLAQHLVPHDPRLLSDADARVLLDFARYRSDDWQPGELWPLERLLASWNGLLQQRVGELIEGLAPTGRAPLRPALVEQAEKERDHLLKDHSMRPRRLEREPSYELVRAISRHPRLHAGFHVRSVQRRIDDAPLDEDLARRIGARFGGEGDDVGLVSQLVGRVRSPSLVDYLGTADARAAQAALARSLDRDGAQRLELAAQAGEVLHPDQKVGGSGLELAFDGFLAGTNGFRETIGLTERAERGALLTIPPHHGQDLVLTLDLDLQRAAREVIELPAEPQDPKRDQAWYRHPVGAILLITPEGEVLAAASAPGRDRGARPEVLEALGKLDDEALFVRERAFHRPTNQTPGSTFKPFVALHALRFGMRSGAGEHVGFGRTAFQVTCTGAHNEGSAHEHVACHSTWGHGSGVDLEKALKVSCNAYFAALASHLSHEDLREVATRFGFRERTGIGDALRVGDAGESGFVFESGAGGDLWGEGAFSLAQRQRTGNGLTELNCTPAQVARAYAGLATGRLPRLRLVREAGGRPFELAPAAADTTLTPEDLEAFYGRENLEVVRQHLRQVVADPDGSAHQEVLQPDSIGFTFACKTGSADMAPGLVPDPEAPQTLVPGMRKQTWVAGWFPAEDPLAVVVVFVHDTSATSSHGAVQLAAQFLGRPEVKAFVEAERVR